MKACSNQGVRVIFAVEVNWGAVRKVKSGLMMMVRYVRVAGAWEVGVEDDVRKRQLKEVVGRMTEPGHH